MKMRSEIKMQANRNFRAQYGISVAAYLVFVLLVGAVSGATFGVGALFVMPPLIVGYCSLTLRVYRYQRADIGDMFSEGFNDYWRNVGGILWMELFITLWTLLLIIPGIVKSIAYSMTPYILADTRQVRPTEALKLSMRMTYGYKGEIFVLYLSFIGWWLLSAFTFGLLPILYVGPYFQTSLAGMYEELKQNALQRGTIAPHELA